MPHEERLRQCEESWDDFKTHKAESVIVRSDVTKHNEQILTLNRAHEATMQDIKDIKHDLSSIKADILGIKIWILGGVLGIAVTFAVPMYGLISANGEVKEKIFRLEKLHPYGSMVSTQGTIMPMEGK
jgi:hypothetical protein